ncbi:MAG: ABC transporter substrate-binding protein [Acidimicrobiales bacterium]
MTGLEQGKAYKPGERGSGHATRRRVRLRGAAVLAAIGLTAAACGTAAHTSTSPSTTKPKAISGGTATFAELPSAPPTWIFPFMSLAHFAVNNISQFQQLMYRPLYWFGKAGQPVLNSSYSLAHTPVYSNGNKTVTVTLKHYMWSNGTPVNASNVVFWMNLMKAEKKNWAAYVPGAFPDNVVSYKATNAHTVVFTLNKGYSSKWFTYNELSQVTPLPLAWDVTAPGTAGTCATSVSGCAAVYTYLHGQSKLLSTYATNPLWQVVDGPWRLQSFSTDGRLSMVPNTKYSGPVKPKLSKFVELPYTNSAAEFNAVKSSTGPTVGYIPFPDAAQVPLMKSKGNQVSPWINWAINYFPINYNNPTAGPIFKQLYFRQAMQHLVDQPTMIRVALHGYGSPTYGPVPVAPANPFATSYEKSNPYPYSPSKAISLLKSHGWTVVPNGVSTCAKPGSGAGQCGPGVPAGAKANFNLQYASGSTHVTVFMETMKSSFSKAGIVLNLSTAPFATVIGNAVPTSKTWQMENWGAGWIFSPDYYPTGGEIFATGAGSNSGNYSNPVNDANIAKSHVSSAALAPYQDFLSKSLPVVWQPSAPYQITLIKSTLHGVTPQNPLLALTPEKWYFTGG